MTNMPIPKRTVMNDLAAHRNIVLTSDPDEMPTGVLLNDDFDTLEFLSMVLDRYGLEVQKTMWVDGGQKFVLQSGESVAIGSDSRLD